MDLICKTCSKKFKFQSSLSRHERIHRQLMVQCSCGVSFSRGDNLKRHQFTSKNCRANENAVESSFTPARKNEDKTESDSLASTNSDKQADVDSNADDMKSEKSDSEDVKSASEDEEPTIQKLVKHRKIFRKLRMRRKLQKNFRIPGLPLPSSNLIGALQHATARARHMIQSRTHQKGIRIFGYF